MKQLTIRWKILAVAFIILAFATGVEYGHLSSSPNIGWNLAGGNQGPCNWFISLDATTPTARAEINTVVSSVTYPPGATFNGAAGEDIGTFVNALMAASTKFCFGTGTFPISAATPINANKNNVTIIGAGRELTEFVKTGNGDGIDVSGNGFTASDFSITVSSPQSSGTGIKLCAAACNIPGTPIYWTIISKITIGGWYGAGTQSWFNGMYVQATYSQFSDMLVSNFVNAGITVDGIQNDEHFTDVQMGQQNFGKANNPTYCWKIGWTQAAYYTNLLTTYCKFAIYINPGNGEFVFWQYFTNLQLADTTGMHIFTGTTGTGVLRQLHFTNLGAASDCEDDTGHPGLGCIGSVNELPSVLFQNVQAATVEGGEVAGNTWEGVIVNGTTTDFDAHGWQVRDNNLGNNVGIDGFFTGAPTPNWFINAASARIRIIGGSADNAGIGTTGHAGGIYTNVCQNCYFEGVGFLTSAGARMANAIGCNSNCFSLSFVNNFGLNPFGNITSPFSTAGSPKSVGLCTGCSVSYVSGTFYTVGGFNLNFAISGGTTATFAEKDENGVLLFTGFPMSNPQNFYLPLGFQEAITCPGTCPTVSVAGN